MKKIGIFYIATGRYITFWEEFYNSCEQYFLPEYEKHYFIFTDYEGEIIGESTNSEKIHKYHQNKLGWPYDTLMRFEIFLKAEKDFEMMDYLFFFNANMKIVSPITDDIFQSNKGLMAFKHPGFFNKSNTAFSYDRNPNSSAYIPIGEGEYYIMGGLNGGKKDDYLQLIKTLRQNVQSDLDKGVIALWHDESHLNRYFLNHKENTVVLSEKYGVPEGWEKRIPNAKIIIRDKSHYRYGGHDWLRGLTNIKTEKPQSKLNKIFAKRTFVWLDGGLGNQLYMIAYACFLRENGFKNITLFSRKKERGDTQNTKKRNVLDDFAKVLGLPLIYLPNKAYRFLKYLHKKRLYKPLYSKFIKAYPEDADKWAVYKECPKQETYFSVHSGYYQSYLYQNEFCRTKIKTFIENKVSLPEKYKATTKDVAVHIRRGDFTAKENASVYSYITTDYYLDGLKKHSEKEPIGKVFILSDDFEAITEEIKAISELYNVVLVQGNSVLQDVRVLMQFGRYVLGNSTFAWWGAKLSENENPCIIVPAEPWKKPMPDKTPYPPQWLTVPN